MVVVKFYGVIINRCFTDLNFKQSTVHAKLITLESKVYQYGIYVYGSVIDCKTVN